MLGGSGNDFLVLPQLLVLPVVNLDQVNGSDCCRGVFGSLGQLLFLLLDGWIDEPADEKQDDDGWDAGRENDECQLPGEVKGNQETGNKDQRIIYEESECL